MGKNACGFLLPLFIYLKVSFPYFKKVTDFFPVGLKNITVIGSGQP